MDKMPVKFWDYKDKRGNLHPMIILPLGKDRKGKEYQFGFGLKKALAILMYIQDIEEWVNKQTEEKEHSQKDEPPPF